MSADPADGRSDFAFVADMVLSGQVREFGVRYSFGVYNLFNWQYRLPVAETFPVLRFPQTARTFIASLQLTL